MNLQYLGFRRPLPVRERSFREAILLRVSDDPQSDLDGTRQWGRRSLHVVGSLHTSVPHLSWVGRSTVLRLSPSVPVSSHRVAPRVRVLPGRGGQCGAVGT